MAKISLFSIVGTGLLTWVCQQIGWIQIQGFSDQSVLIQLLWCFLFAFLFYSVLGIIIQVLQAAGGGCLGLVVILFAGPITSWLAGLIVPGLVTFAGGFVGSLLLGLGLIFIPILVGMWIFGILEEIKEQARQAGMQI